MKTFFFTAVAVAGAATATPTVTPGSNCTASAILMVLVCRRGVQALTGVWGRGAEARVLLHQDICMIHPLTYLQLHLSGFAPKILFLLQVHLLALELREAVFAPAMPHEMCALPVTLAEYNQTVPVMSVKSRCDLPVCTIRLWPLFLYNPAVPIMSVQSSCDLPVCTIRHCP